MLGTRPTATSTTSQSSVSDLPPAAGSSVSFTLLPLVSTFTTLVPSLKASPCFVSTRSSCFATSASSPGASRGSISTTVTAAPSRDQTEPSSSPI